MQPTNHRDEKTGFRADADAETPDVPPSCGPPQPSLLLTGQFWNPEFSDLVNRLAIPTTVLRVGQILALEQYPVRFDLVLVCKERRGSISQPVIDRLHQLFPQATVVVLLGSWCEGESRSGYPLQGAESIFWHQWQGSFDQLAGLAGSGSIPVLGAICHSGDSPADLPLIGVSALTTGQYESLAEAVGSLGGIAVWLEQASWQASALEQVVAVIVDDDGISGDLDRRIGLVKSLCPGRPLVCAIGFPRKNEVLCLQVDHGVRQVVSKPFDLVQLGHAIRGAAGIEMPLPVRDKTASGRAPILPGIASALRSSERPAGL